MAANLNANMAVVAMADGRYTRCIRLDPDSQVDKCYKFELEAESLHSVEAAPDLCSSVQVGRKLGLLVRL